MVRSMGRPQKFLKKYNNYNYLWRKGRDSNPRGSVNPLAVFKTAALNHSATLPRRSAPAVAKGFSRRKGKFLGATYERPKSRATKPGHRGSVCGPIAGVAAGGGSTTSRCAWPRQ